MLLDGIRIRKLAKLGIDDVETEDQAKAALVLLIKEQIPDISIAYSLEELLNIGCSLILEPTCEAPKAKVKKIKKPVVKSYEGLSRKKIRVNLKVDPSYAMPLTEHLARFDEIEVCEINTGLAVKFVDGMTSNIINYNHLRTIKGLLYGHLYLNVVRDEERLSELGIEANYDWFRGYAMLPKRSIYEVVEILNSKNVERLKNYCRVSHKRRNTNAQTVLGKIQ